MSIKSTVFAALAAFGIAGPGFAQGIAVHDPYIAAASPAAKSAAAYFVVHNHSETDDHLIETTSPVAKKVQLHTSKQGTDGVMRMVHLKDGVDLPANGELVFERGGHHVMFMGLSHPLEQGTTIPLTLVFEQHGEVTIDVTVDHEHVSGGLGHNHSD